MTFVVDATADADVMVAELRKLDDITEIRDISGHEFVSRELALIRVRGEKEMRKRLMDIVDIFGAKIVDVGFDSLTLMVAGSPSTLDAMSDLLAPFGILEQQRTGRVALPRLARQPTRLRAVRGRAS